MSHSDEAVHPCSIPLGNLSHQLHSLSKQHNLLCFYQRTRLEKLGQPLQTLGNILGFGPCLRSVIALVQYNGFRPGDSSYTLAEMTDDYQQQTMPGLQSMFEYELGGAILDDFHRVMEEMISLANQPVFATSPVDQLILNLQYGIQELNQHLANYQLAATYARTNSLQQWIHCCYRQLTRDFHLMRRYLRMSWSPKKISLLRTIICGNLAEKLHFGLLTKEIELIAHILKACEETKRNVESIAVHLDELVVRVQEEAEIQAQGVGEKEMFYIEESDLIERVRNWLGIE
ncbi:hypothetical protein BDV93DRAFT_609388 [Ceratobasidium sp. AG-I]|nr:hypothetical protein BDV93DRAFT_609388 [Ceratobasidium sp. AG-I]